MIKSNFLHALGYNISWSIYNIDNCICINKEFLLKEIVGKIAITLSWKREGKEGHS